MAYDYVQQETSLKSQIVCSSQLNFGMDNPNDSQFHFQGEHQ